jgi:hypothetical protein
VLVSRLRFSPFGGFSLSLFSIQIVQHMTASRHGAEKGIAQRFDWKQKKTNFLQQFSEQTFGMPCGVLEKVPFNYFQSSVIDNGESNRLNGK